MSERPLLLDLFCGAGGAGVGYKRAGFRVVGVDIVAQPRYPLPFGQADAMAVLRSLILTDNIHGYAAVHASPPCQAHSDLQKQSKLEYLDYIPELRELLTRVGLPYVIENVEGAPLRKPIVLCGTQFPGLRVIRHRLFESNFPLKAPPHIGKHPLVFTFDKRKAHFIEDPVARAAAQRTMYVQVTGGGNATVANKADAMGIDWMRGKELNEAIPPAYTEYIGRQLMEHISLTQAA
jgi:DNA (cytosine-5)-methyltransferase 1